MKKLWFISAIMLCSLASATIHAEDITVTNAVGEQVVPHNPQRVVVLDFSAVDTLRVLGVQDKIVGIPRSTKVPDYLSEFNTEKYTNVGTPPEPAFEKINELNPDLIIATGRQQKILDKLKEIAPVFYVQTDYENYYTGFQQNMRAFAKIFDRQQLVEDKLTELSVKISDLAKKTEKKTALLLLVNESKMSAFGDTSRYALVYKNYGFTPIDLNIKSSTHGMSVGFEYILEKNPDYLLVVDRTAALTDKAQNAQKVLDNKLIKQTNAYKNNHIVYLNAANWYLTFGGLQGMFLMLDEVAQAVK